MSFLDSVLAIFGAVRWERLPKITRLWLYESEFKGVNDVAV